MLAIIPLNSSSEISFNSLSLEAITVGLVLGLKRSCYLGLSCFCISVLGCKHYHSYSFTGSAFNVQEGLGCSGLR